MAQLEVHNAGVTGTSRIQREAGVAMGSGERSYTVLFLCTGNSCRSQMAEGWARHLHGDSMSISSAGIEKHGMDARAARVMSEAGVDISRQRSKLIEELDDKAFDYVITLCDHAQESCPLFPGHARMLHAGFSDPRVLAADTEDEEQKIAYYREVRDQIRVFVQGLPQILARVPNE